MSDLIKITKSKITCTLGPATDSPGKIKTLSDIGMDVARLNFSHGTLEYKENLFNTVRNVDPTLAILCDIQGPKIRIGEIGGNGANLITGNKTIITTEKIVGDENRFTLLYEPFHQEAEIGDLIFINDGIVCVEVESIHETDITCNILSGGFISTRKGVNLPHTNISLGVPTPKDVEDLKLIAKLDPEYVAISFVKDHNDVLRVKKVLSENGNDNIKLISKIERPIALENFDSILKVSDGIMVARGDLGVEIPPEDVLPAQKEMITKSNVAGKPIIVATQMLESMVNAPVPTRAEVADVFNAIEDGADAVMLSAETAAGKFPFEAVEIMERIIKVSEAQMPLRNPDDYDSEEETIAEIVGHLVFSSCKEFSDMSLKDAKIMCLTHSGLSARLVSKYRPTLPILAITSQQKTARELRLVWGVEPLWIPDIDKETTNVAKIQQSTKIALEKGYIDKDEKLIIAGNIFFAPARTNMLSIFAVQDILDSMG
ncbi:MAG: pyruvate kinase [Candidatus Hodarchaeota archaeon]